MRLIDADVLKEAFEEDGHLSGYIEEFIDDTPTIDTVKHGNWQMIGIRLCADHYRCTVCDAEVVIDAITPTRRPPLAYNYCPNCGSKMDGVLPAKYGGFYKLDDPSKLKGVDE